MQRHALLVLLAILSTACGGEDIGQSDDGYLRQLNPCGAGQCWQTGLELRACGFAVVEENFSSGAFNVHRHAVRLGEGVNRVRLTRHDGDWEPAIVVSDDDGRTLFDGTSGAAHVQARVVARTRNMFEVELELDQATEAHVFTTSRAALISGFSTRLPTDAVYDMVVDNSCDVAMAHDALAPAGAFDGEPASSGGNDISIRPDWGQALRFDVPASTHVTFRLSASNHEMQILQWTGDAVEEMAITTGRTMAVLDDFADRTYWVRARGDTSTSAVSATYLPFRKGLTCEDDCARLMQLPLANDPEQDGYDMVEGVVYRYQFGRRDVLMSVRDAGRVIASQGVMPFTVEDLSKESGAKPPGHASHTEGKDIDLSVYDVDGNATWIPQCNETGDNCIRGTDFGMDVDSMARKIGALVAGERITHIFLDREFHDRFFAAADDLVAMGMLPPSAVPYMKSVVMHWPNHNNHIHIRYQTD